MKTLREITRECWNSRHESDIENILKEWGHQIIDTCAGNFECTMESDNGEKEYPVLMRGSILAVKNMIK